MVGGPKRTAADILKVVRKEEGGKEEEVEERGKSATKYTKQWKGRERKKEEKGKG